MGLNVHPDILEKAYTKLAGVPTLLNQSGDASVSSLSTTDALQQDFNTWNDSGAQWVIERHRVLHAHITDLVSSAAGLSSQLAGLMRSTIDSVAKTEDTNKTSLDKNADQVAGARTAG
jgi:hypothetical protein